MKVVTIGLGYIGLPTSALIASKSIPVHGVDINESVVKTINQGKIHIIEPDLDVVVKDVVKKGFLKASTTPIEGDIYLIVVPTPFKGNYEPDISYVEDATKSILHYLKPGDLYIIESTSPVGTTEQMAEFIFMARPELKDKINIAYCPERVLPGNVMFELVNNDRVIGGINDSSTKAAVTFYSKIVKGKLHKTNARTAEMCKLVENSSRDVQIAFANELSLICDKAGINVWELISLANRHPRVNILQPGCGVGGHCIAVDPYFIISEFAHESRLMSVARKVNNYKTLWCVDKICNSILKFKLEFGRNPIISLMGLSFKPNIDDLRESPAETIVGELISEMPDMDFLISEPNVKSHKIYKLTNYKDAFESSDIVVLLVAHKEFEELNKGKNKQVLNFCGV